MRALEHHAGAVRAMVITPDGYLVSLHQDYTARLWDLENASAVENPSVLFVLSSKGDRCLEAHPDQYCETLERC